MSDFSNRRVQEFSSTGTFIKMFGWGVKDKKEEAEVCTSACYAGIQGGGKGEFWDPYGLAFDSKGNVWVADTGGSRVEEFSNEGKYITEFGTKGSAKGQLNEPRGITFDSKGNIWVADSSNNRIQEFSSTTIGEALAVYGSTGPGPDQFNNPIALTFDSKGNLWVADLGNNRLEELNSTGTYMQVVGSKGSGNGQLNEPRDLTFDSKGNIWVADKANNRVEEWAPGNPAAHDARTIYYTTKEEAEVSTCRNHPEWAGLPCETTSVAQPGTSGLPELPVNTYVYNIWDGVEKTTEEFVSAIKTKVVRTKTQTYDPAGRALTSETSSTIDTTLPKVTNEYNTETGALIKQSATIKGETKTITSKYNTLGRSIEYTDAEGATTKYAYEMDGRTKEISYELPGKSTATQRYSYNTTTGLMTESSIDTSPNASMTFTASYDVEGNLTSETYPNGMSATYTLNPAGQATGSNTSRRRTAPKNATWFSDTIVPSIHGETLQQTSTLARENYTYDNAADSPRSRKRPRAKAAPPASTPTTKNPTAPASPPRTRLRRQMRDRRRHRRNALLRHRQPADRHRRELRNVREHHHPPANDAGGHELTSEYYVDSQIATQNTERRDDQIPLRPRWPHNGNSLRKQRNQSKNDSRSPTTPAPAKRSPGQAKAPKNGPETFPGSTASLDAIQKSGEQPILQLHDLKGNIVATAALSETETKLLSTYNSTEFGVPQSGTSAPPYSWLGALDISSSLPTSGTVTTGASSYEPEIGRPLQTEPTASPGAFPDGTGGAGIVGAPYLGADNNQLRAIAVQQEAELEAAKRREAEEHARMAECPASACHVDGPGEGNCETNCVMDEYEFEGGVALEDEGEEATVAGRKKPFQGQEVGKCKFKVSITGTEAEATFSNRYECTVNVNLVAWDYVGIVPGAVYTANGTRGGWWASEVINVNPFGISAGLCVQISWLDKDKPRETSECFAGGPNVQLANS